MRKRRTSIGIFILAVFVWLTPRELIAQLQRVRVSYSAPSTSIAFEVARARGFYTEEGLDVELVHVHPRLAPIALTNGEIDFTTTFNNTLQGIIQGLPLRFVFVSVRKGAFFLIARPDIKSVKALVNKKIGVTNLTSIDHVTAEEMLRTKGVTLAGVTFLGLGNEGLRIQSLRAGAVDAIAIAPPHHLSLVSLGFQKLAGPEDVRRVRPLSGIAAANRQLKQRPQVVKQMTRALLKSHRFIFENKQRTTEIMARWLAQPMESAAGSYDLLLLTLSANGEISDEEWTSLNIAPRSVDEVRDFSFLREARRELGIR